MPEPASAHALAPVSMLNRAARAAETIARLAVWAGGAMLLFAAFLVSTDVLLRKLFSITFTGSDEISGYLFAISTSWAMAYVLVNRGFIRIDALYLLFPRRVCAILDVVALLALGAFMAFFAYRAFGALATTIEMGARSTTPLRTPIVVPQSAWLLGLLFFLVVWAVTLLRAVTALARGDLVAANAIAGAPTLDEEVGQELGTTEALIERKARA